MRHGLSGLLLRSIQGNAATDDRSRLQAVRMGKRRQLIAVLGEKASLRGEVGRIVDGTGAPRAGSVGRGAGDIVERLPRCPELLAIDGVGEEVVRPVIKRAEVAAAAASASAAAEARIPQPPRQPSEPLPGASVQP